MTKRIPIAECEICREIKDSESADYIRDPEDHLPEASHKLEDVQKLGYYYPTLEQCPLCRRYYIYNTSCGYMEHDESLQRLSDELCDWIDSQPKGSVSLAEIEKKQRLL